LQSQIRLWCGQWRPSFEAQPSFLSTEPTLPELVVLVQSSKQEVPQVLLVLEPTPSSVVLA
jgi:hypothetical protein